MSFLPPTSDNGAPPAPAAAPPAAPAPAPAAAAPPATPDWLHTDFSDPKNVQAYYDSRGVKPAGTSDDYWAGKYNEFGKNDPNYYLKFLSNAEEFTGGPAQTARAMGWKTAKPLGASPSSVLDSGTSTAPGAINTAGDPAAQPQRQQLGGQLGQVNSAQNQDAINKLLGQN